jgi:hypothetical protein
VDAGAVAGAGGTDLSSAAGALVAAAGVDPGLLSPALAGAVTGRAVRSSKLPESVGRKLPK